MERRAAEPDQREAHPIPTIDQREQQAAGAVNAQMRAVLDALPQLVWSCLPDGYCDLFNRRWVEYTGAAEADQLGTRWIRYVHPDDAEALLNASLHSIATGAEYAGEIRLRRYDGEYRWFAGRALPLRSDDGQIVRWVGANTDIHDSRALREQLRIEQERQGVVLDNASGVLLSFELGVDGHARFSYVSGGAKALYGFTPEQILADERLLFSRVHREDRGKLLASFEASARDRAPLSCEFRYNHPELGERWLQANSKPRFLPDGRTVWSGLVVDTSGRNRTEEALRLTRAQLESALEAADMGVWTWDYERDRAWGSDGMRRLWHLPEELPAWFHPEELLRRVHPDDLPRTREAGQRAIATGERFECEYRILTPVGERWIDARARVDRGADGHSRLTGINLDITQQKSAAEVALQSQKLEALGTLAGGIAHDFNNVLFAITGNATLALSELSNVAEGTRVRTFLEDILSASARASELVRQILAFSRPQDRKLESLELAAPVQEALKMIRATLPATIELKVELHPETPPVLVDAAQVVQVVVNLCTNAAHAIGKERQGNIQVRLEPVHAGADDGERIPPGRYALLSVRDDGAGIEDALQTRIFDPFFTTKAVGQGTGLGLSVVHGIMRGLGGHVRLWSRVGEGALFRLYFPENGAARPRSDAPIDDQPRTSGRRFLLVDDEAMVVKVTQGYLAVLGHRAEAFQDSREALAAFRRDPSAFDAVLTDLAMPTVSGFELVRAVRALRSDIPVLMMSGSFGVEEQRTAAALGVRELALKPLELSQLRALLASMF